MEHRVPELIEWATTVMTMNSGDLIACGTNHEGLGFLQDGETVDIEIEHIGKMTLDGARSTQAELGTWRLHGRGFDQPGRREAPSPARRPDRHRRDLKLRRVCISRCVARPLERTNQPLVLSAALAGIIR